MNYVRLIDPVKYLCDEYVCPAVINAGGKQIPLVWDTCHPSTAASRLLASKINKDLDWLVGKQ
jgi:hypothetical protein